METAILENSDKPIVWYSFSLFSSFFSFVTCIIFCWVLAVSGTGCRLSPGQTKSQQWVWSPDSSKVKLHVTQILPEVKRILSTSTTYVFSMEEAFSTNQQAASCHQLAIKKCIGFWFYFGLLNLNKKQTLFSSFSVFDEYYEDLC